MNSWQDGQEKKRKMKVIFGSVRIVAVFVAIRGTSRAAGLPRVDHFEGFSKVLCLVAVSVGYATRQWVGGTCCIIHKIPEAPQVVVEGLFSFRELFCGTSALVPVGARPVMGIVRLPLQIDGLHARIRQIVTRYLLEGWEVGEVLDDIIEAITTSFHFILTASFLWLSSCKVIHHSLYLGVEYVALSFLVFQVCPRLFERSIHKH